MKKLLIIALMLGSFAQAHECFQSVQEQLRNMELSVPGYDLSLSEDQVVEKKLSQLKSGLLYSKTNLDQTEVLPSFLAEASAIGCYGFEYVFFDANTCEILAIGGGHCD